MEDFREIVGFLIIGIGILLSVLKERKSKNSSDSTPSGQNTPIERRPINPHPQGQQPSPRPRPQSSASAAITSAPAAKTILPFGLSSVTARASQHQQQEQELRSGKNTTSTPVHTQHTQQTQQTKSASSYGDLPEEGARVTKDIAPIETLGESNAQEEEEFIEKLREGIILSEILQRKF